MNDCTKEMTDKIHEIDKKVDSLGNKIDTLLATTETLNQNQKYTNGKVRGLQIWKAGLTGATGVLTMISGWLVLDYMDSRYDTLTRSSRQDQEIIFLKDGIAECRAHILDTK